MDKIRVLMSTDNVQAVSFELANCIKCYEDARKTHESFLILPLPQDEVVKQTEHFHAKLTKYCGFMESVKCWLSDAGHPYVQSNEVSSGNHSDAGSGGIHPEDSVSNVESNKSHSQLSRIS